MKKEIKITKKEVFSAIWDILFFAVGSFLYAVSINVFSSPNNIAAGGFTGIATMLNYLFDLPIGITIIVLNIPFLIWGAKELGTKFLIKTIIATFTTSIAIDLTAPFLPVYTGDMMITCIFGGVLSGIGLALVYMRGGATGGTDLIAKLLSKRIRFLSLGHLIMCVDFFVIIATVFVYQTVESPLYSIIFLFVTTKLIDTVLYGMDSGTGKMMFIISPKNEEIKQQIMEQLSRGVTELKSRGGYSGVEGEVLLCAVRPQEVHKTYDIVREVDASAFIIVGDAGEITGLGFKEHGDQ